METGGSCMRSSDTGRMKGEALTVAYQEDKEDYV